MTDISCDICRDLLPLVQDGIASPDSEAAVREHLARCPHCRALSEGAPPPPTDGKAVLRRARHWLRLLAALVLMYGLLLGLNLSGGQNLFYNILLMPAIGALGYCLFRWKALLELPVLLFLTHLLLNAISLLGGGEALFWLDILVWSFLYSLFCMLGTLIAGLLHFAFRKEK